MEEILSIAIQKSGRLSEESLKLIKECGIDLNNGTGKLKAQASNFPIQFLFLRDDDIPGYVSDGVADLGIVGENVMIEKNDNVSIAHRLGFSKCRLSIAIPKEHDYKGVADLAHMKVATSYPRILKNFLDANLDAFEGRTYHTEVHEISGSVEIAPSIGLADAICDIVSSGSTLLSNGLKEVEVIFRSEAVLIEHQGLSAAKKNLLEQLLFRIKAVQNARNNKYILLNVPNEAIAQVTALLPGMQSPSILPLAKEGWSSLHSVINENEFWNRIEGLKQAGAEGILIVPIEKMIL